MTKDVTNLLKAKVEEVRKYILKQNSHYDTDTTCAQYTLSCADMLRMLHTEGAKWISTFDTEAYLDKLTHLLSDLRGADDTKSYTGLMHALYLLVWDMVISAAEDRKLTPVKL